MALFYNHWTIYFIYCVERRSTAQYGVDLVTLRNVVTLRNIVTLRNVT